ncbi:uncharacterized protein LOC119675647 [Teleopsis dalmanni]|uniref:uncharacterized protein LOC119675647 n=1 Tax=Teleopsis dalmanni TaxID=139649 RepID=UPI0018CF7D37|nr:uncharacterized protein LOC119675647 [Teleopsis dalmanni]
MSLHIINTSDRPTEATIKVSFDTERNAEIAYRVLKVDVEPRRNFVQKEFTLQGLDLEVHFVSDEVKNLRSAIASFFELLVLCTDTIKAFGRRNASSHTSSKPT